MKNVLSLALIVITISILFSSCSQISNSSFSRPHNQGTHFSESGANLQSEPMKDDITNFQVKGYSSAQADREEKQDTLISKQLQVVSPQNLIPVSVVNKTVEPAKVRIKNYNLYAKGSTNKNIDALSDYKENLSNSQTTNYSGGSGHSARGVPFWLIVICAIVIPPLGVALAFGIVDKFWICLALTFCFWLPGMIYALIQIVG